MGTNLTPAQADRQRRRNRDGTYAPMHSKGAAGGFDIREDAAPEETRWDAAHALIDAVAAPDGRQAERLDAAYQATRSPMVGLAAALAREPLAAPGRTEVDLGGGTGRILAFDPAAPGQATFGTYRAVSTSEGPILLDGAGREANPESLPPDHPFHSRNLAGTLEWVDRRNRDSAYTARLAREAAEAAPRLVDELLCVPAGGKVHTHVAGHDAAVSLDRDLVTVEACGEQTLVHLRHGTIREGSEEGHILGLAIAHARQVPDASAKPPF